MDERTLVVFSQFRGSAAPGHKVLLTRRLYDGMARYAELWKGPVKLVCRASMRSNDDLDPLEVSPRGGPFETVCREFSPELLQQLLVPGTVVLAGLGREPIDLGRRCRAVGIPCVYATEYTLETRIAIARVYRRSPLHGWWRSWQERRLERTQLRALGLAQGVQCNGTPTYEAYRDLTPRPLLFFDGRVDAEMLATPERISTRLERFRRERTLRLVFSGRLKRMKGVDQLPAVANHLRALGVPFRLTIIGDGECVPFLRDELPRLDLTSRVKLLSPMEFKTQWVPYVTEGADLFVCCHRQGDPSCTYLETMACGVPIIGYDNEALRGICQTSDAGWVTPMDRPLVLARLIRDLYDHPGSLEKAAWKSLEFAREHTFDQTFRRRVDHLERVAVEFDPASACPSTATA